MYFYTSVFNKLFVKVATPPIIIRMLGRGRSFIVYFQSPVVCFENFSKMAISVGKLSYSDDRYSKIQTQ